MKKIISLVLVLCFLLSVASVAFAANPKFTQQPKTATTSKDGKVSFSVKAKNIQGLTWFFVDPATGEKYTGKQIASKFKGLKVTGPNKQTITLKKVPDEMHGWTVYCHITGNGYQLDSDSVQLLVYGMEEPGTAATQTDTGSDAPPAETPAEPAAEPAAEPVAEPVAEPAAETQPAEQSAPAEASETQPAETVPEETSPKTITISASADILLPIDSDGNLSDGASVSTLEFVENGSFAIRSVDPIRSWTVNDVRFEPAEPVKEFRFYNVTESMFLDITFSLKAAAAPVDESNLCKITCSGCTFTCLSRDLKNVVEGQVPSGTYIIITADSSEQAELGYAINGEEPIRKGILSFRMQVTGDTEIKIP